VGEGESCACGRPLAHRSQALTGCMLPGGAGALCTAGGQCGRTLEGSPRLLVTLHPLARRRAPAYRKGARASGLRASAKARWKETVYRVQRCCPSRGTAPSRPPCQGVPANAPLPSHIHTRSAGLTCRRRRRRRAPAGTARMLPPRRPPAASRRGAAGTRGSSCKGGGGVYVRVCVGGAAVGMRGEEGSAGRRRVEGRGS
jgi:hypothetical protein